MVTNNHCWGAGKPFFGESRSRGPVKKVPAPQHLYVTIMLLDVHTILKNIKTKKVSFTI